VPTVLPERKHAHDGESTFALGEHACRVHLVRDDLVRRRGPLERHVCAGLLAPNGTPGALQGYRLCTKTWTALLDAFSGASPSTSQSFSGTVCNTFDPPSTDRATRSSEPCTMSRKA